MLKLPLATVAVASYLNRLKPNLRRTTVMMTNPWLNSNTAREPIRCSSSSSNARFQQMHILLPTTSPESSTVNFSTRSEMFSLQTVPKPGSGSGPHSNDNKPVAQPKVNHTRSNHSKCISPSPLLPYSTHTSSLYRALAEKKTAKAS
jgi:hypothetical protein